MLAHAEEIDVFDDDRLVVFDRKQRAVQQMIDITLIALRHKSQALATVQRFSKPLRGFPPEQATR